MNRIRIFWACLLVLAGQPAAWSAVLSTGEEGSDLAPHPASDGGSFFGLVAADTNSELAMLLLKAVRNVPREARVRDAERVLALDPDDAAAQQTLARLYLADQRLDEAAELLWKVARAAPEQLERIEEWRFALLASGDHANGYKVYEELVRRGHQSLAVRFNHAAACYHVGRSTQALQGMQRFLEGQPNHLRGLYNLGVMQYALGQREQAAATWERLLALRPGHPIALAALARLRSGSGQTAQFESLRDQLVRVAGAPAAAALLGSAALPLYLMK